MPPTLPAGLQKPGCPRSVTRSKVVAVEGQTGFYFVLNALQHLGLDGEVEIHNFGGKDELGAYLRPLVITPGFEGVVSLGIVRDAEGDAASALASVRHALQTTGCLAVPDRYITPAGDAPRVAVYIMPDCANPGMVETLCLQSVAADPALPCVDRYFACLAKAGVPAPHNMAKAKAHAFLATRPNPELLVAQAAREGYWPWDSPAFNPLKDFLRSL